MARTSKTKVGGGPDQGTMLHAAEAGAAAESSARSESIAQQERIGASVRGQFQNAADTYSKEQVRQEEAATQQAQFSEQMDLGAAKEGLQRNPEFERRQRELQEEMQRGEKQNTAPSEFDGQRFIPTERKTKEEDRKLQIQETRNRIMQQNALSRAANASSKGDIEAYKAERQNYAGLMKSQIGIADKIIRNDSQKLTPSEKADIAELAKNNPDPQLQKEIQTGLYGPRTAELVRGKAFFDSLPFVALRGDFPDADLIDYSNPQYKEFVNTYIPQAQTWLKQRQAVAPIVGVNSFEDAQRLMRQAAAIAMLKAGFSSRERATAKSMGVEESPELPPPSMNPNAPAPPGAAEQQAAITAAKGPPKTFNQESAGRPMISSSEAMPKWSSQN